MKRYNIDIEISYGTGLYDGDEYADIRIRDDKDGEWVKAIDVDQLISKIKRMQKRIDEHEGRI